MSRSLRQVADLIMAAAFLFVVCVILPPAASVLEFNREAIAHGQIWRVFTGHLVHWSLEHAFWDSVTLFVLWAFAKRTVPGERAQVLFVYTVVVSSVVVSAMVTLLSPEFQLYRGLSGICVAQFTALAVFGFRRAMTVEDQRSRKLFALLLASVVCKTVYEIAAGTTIFVNDANFVVATSAHFGGLLSGLVCGAGAGRYAGAWTRFRHA